LTLRSIIRPDSRKANRASSSASIRPVSTTGTPAARFSTVTVRTGRTSGAGSSPQAVSTAASAKANQGKTRGPRQRRSAERSKNTDTFPPRAPGLDSRVHFSERDYDR
jgi:hypothetical protein